MRSAPRTSGVIRRAPIDERPEQGDAGGDGREAEDLHVVPRRIAGAIRANRDRLFELQHILAGPLHDFVPRVAVGEGGFHESRRLRRVHRLGPSAD